MKKKIEYEVGETFKYKGVWLKVEEARKCNNCFFNKIEKCPNLSCVPYERLDGKYIIFIQIDKKRFSEIWKEFLHIKINKYNYGTKRFEIR